MGKGQQQRHSLPCAASMIRELIYKLNGNCMGFSSAWELSYGFNMGKFSFFNVPQISHSLQSNSQNIWIWYGTEIKRSHSIPISDLRIPKCYGSSMELCEVRRNPIDTRQDHMVLLRGSPMQFPCNDMENVWNFTKYVAIPQEQTIECHLRRNSDHVWV